MPKISALAFIAVHAIRYRRVVDPYGGYVMRARTERAKVISALLNGAAACLGNLIGKAVRGHIQASRNIASSVALARRRRAAIRELGALDDWLLNDIGISRNQISYLVDEHLSVEHAERTKLTGQDDIGREIWESSVSRARSFDIGRAKCRGMHASDHPAIYRP